MGWISGAPRTFSFSWQTRMLKKSFMLKQTRIKRQVYRPKSDGKVGFGGYVFSDKNGLFREQAFRHHMHIIYGYSTVPSSHLDLLLQATITRLMRDR